MKTHRILTNYILRDNLHGRLVGVDPEGRWGTFDSISDTDDLGTHVNGWLCLPYPFPAIAGLLSFSSGFEFLGCYEAIAQRHGEEVKDLGTRLTTYVPARGLGAASQLDYVFEHKVTLTKGHREATYDFRKSPARCIGLVHVLCGRAMQVGWVPEGFSKVTA